MIYNPNILYSTWIGRESIQKDYLNKFTLFPRLKGLSHEIDFKNFDINLQNLV